MRLKVYSGLTRNGKDIHGNEFTHAAGPGVRSGTKEFGRSAIPNNQSRQQLVNHRHLSGFHAWLLQIYKREYQFYTKRRNEFTDDVQARQAIYGRQEAQRPYIQFRDNVANFAADVLESEEQAI